MARQMFVVLALIFVAIVGVASATTEPAKPPAGSKGGHASAPAGDKSAADTPAEGASSPTEGSATTPAAADGPASKTADGAASGPAAPAPAPSASGKTTATSMGFTAVTGFATVAAGYFFF